MNVHLDPVQKLPLVQQSHIKVTIFPDLIAGEKPEGTDSVVKFHKDNIIGGFLNEARLVKVDPGITCKTASRDPNPDRELGALRSSGRLEDVDKEAILRHHGAGGLGLSGLLGHSQTVGAILSFVI